MARAQSLADRLQVIAPDRREHYDAILDLTAKAFAHRRYWGWLAYCNEGYMADSHYEWKASRIGVLGGRIVTHFGIWGHRMRIGTAAVRVAGVGAVATDGNYYEQGLMARTAASCVAGLAAAGYHLSMLHGIPGFYHRFGYVRAWPDAAWFADLAALPRRARPPVLRPVTTQWPLLDRLHNRENRALTGTAVRPTYGRNRRPREWKAWFWQTRGGVAGYVVVASGEETFELIDHAGDAEEVLAAVAHLAAEAGLRKVRFPGLHYRSALCRRLRSLSCRHEQQMGSGGWMVRTVSLAATLDRIRPVLAARLAGSGFARWRGELLVEDLRERVALAIGAGRVAVRPAEARAHSHAIRGGDEVAQLLIGSDSSDEVAEAAGLRLSGDARALARALFPAEQPLLPHWDSY